MCFADLGESLDASIIVLDVLDMFVVVFFYQKGLDKIHLSAVIVFDH